MMRERSLQTHVKKKPKTHTHTHQCSFSHTHTHAKLAEISMGEPALECLSHYLLLFWVDVRLQRSPEDVEIAKLAGKFATILGNAFMLLAVQRPDRRLLNFFVHWEIIQTNKYMTNAREKAAGGVKKEQNNNNNNNKKLTTNCVIIPWKSDQWTFQKNFL